MSIKQNLKMLTTGAILGGVLFSGVSYAASEMSIDVYFQPLKYFFDGVEKKAPADQQGFIYNGTTYVPLRFVSEALGKDVGYDAPTFGIYVGKQKEGTETYLEDMQTLTSNQNQGNFKKISTFKTNVGTQFVHGYQVGTYGLYSDNLGRMTNEYLLNGNFKSFQALLAPGEGWNTLNKQENIGHIEIYADDKLVYKSENIASNTTQPVAVNVNLTGVLKLKIDLIQGTGLGLLDAKFIQ